MPIFKRHLIQNGQITKACQWKYYSNALIYATSDPNDVNFHLMQRTVYIDSHCYTTYFSPPLSGHRLVTKRTPQHSNMHICSDRRSLRCLGWWVHWLGPSHQGSRTCRRIAPSSSWWDPAGRPQPGWHSARLRHLSQSMGFRTSLPALEPLLHSRLSDLTGRICFHTEWRLDFRSMRESVADSSSFWRWGNFAHSWGRTGGGSPLHLWRMRLSNSETSPVLQCPTAACGSSVLYLRIHLDPLICKSLFFLWSLFRL